MRVVFACIGSLGDLHPMLALAVEARRRGHEAVVAAAPSYSVNVERAGVEFRELRPEIPSDPDDLAYFFHMSRGPERLLRQVVFAGVRETHADLSAAVRGADALVVGELLYTAGLVAEGEGIPWWNAVLAPTSMLSATDPCVLAPAPFLHPFRKLGAWVHRLAYIGGRIQGRMWAREYFRFRRELGLPPGGNPIFDTKHSPHGTLVMFPEFLGAPQPDWPGNFVQAGFPFYEQGGMSAGLEEFLSAGEAPVVFTLGSIVAHFEPRFYHEAVAAVRMLGRRAVLLTGRNAEVPRDLPETVFVARYEPLGALLPRVAAVVHAGGIGTCAEALRAGVPSVIVPFAFDQPDNAWRLGRLGVARSLSRGGISARNLARRLNEVLGDAGFSTRARGISGGFDFGGAAGMALERVENGVRKSARPSMIREG